MNKGKSQIYKLINLKIFPKSKVQKLKTQTNLIILDRELKRLRELELVDDKI